MAIVRASVRLPWNISTVRGAVSVNNYHFDSGAGTPSNINFATVGNALKALYVTGLDGIWSSILSGTVEVLAYNLNDPKPRQPFYFDQDTLTPETGSLPGEVAAKVQMKAARESGVPAQRHRGTIRLGPLAPAVLDTSGHLTSGALGDIQSAFDTFKTAIGPSIYNWVVGSDQPHKNGSPGTWRNVARLHLSNECGTVGRRQFAETNAANLDI